MKTLVISLKTSTEVLSDFVRAYKAVKRRKLEGSHYEVSFDNKRDFDRFVKNIGILSQILVLKPKSIYELSKFAKMDLSNLNKIILFFEEVGAIQIKKGKVDGREVKKPIVPYDQIQFNLRAA
ncbi:hypothetical protein WDW37_19060 [Bdellovibrionota bacterium FG-1]